MNLSPLNEAGIRRPPLFWHRNDRQRDYPSALRLFDTSYRTWPNSFLPSDCNNYKSDMLIIGSVTQNREDEAEVSCLHCGMQRIEFERSTSAGNSYSDYKIWQFRVTTRFRRPSRKQKRRYTINFETAGGVNYFRDAPRFAERPSVLIPSQFSYQETPLILEPDL